MKTEKLADYFEKLCRTYHEKISAKDIYCFEDKQYKYCQITTDELKYEFVYCIKGNPISTLNCRVYLKIDSQYFFDIQELIDYLDIFDFHCYCFPYIESAARMKACFAYITDFLEYHHEEIVSLKSRVQELTQHKLDEINKVYGYNEELVPSDEAGKESYYGNIFKHYSYFLVKRYITEPAFFAFINGDFEKAQGEYERLEKKTGYEKKLQAFISEQFAPYQAVPAECASMLAIEKYKKTSLKTFALLILACVFMFCLLFLMLQLIANVVYTKNSIIVNTVNPLKAVPCGILPGILTAVAFRKHLEPFLMKNHRSALEFNSLLNKHNDSAFLKYAAFISLVACLIVFLGICKPSIIVYDNYLKYDSGESFFTDYKVYDLEEFSGVVIVEGHYLDHNYTQYEESPYYVFVTKGRGIVSSEDLDLSDEEIEKLINIIEPGMENYKKRHVSAIEDLLL